MIRSKSRYDYYGYKSTWLSKSDLTPKNLKLYGINASLKEIKEKSHQAINGFIYTGGRGHIRRVNKYSISKLNDIFKK